MNGSWYLETYYRCKVDVGVCRYELVIAAGFGSLTTITIKNVYVYIFRSFEGRRRYASRKPEGFTS
jgi:hypothetical protein